MILKRLSIPMDLSETSLYQASKESYARADDGVTLYISTALIGVANLLKMEYLIDDQLVGDQWYVKTKWHGVFSPGA